MRRALNEIDVAIGANLRQLRTKRGLSLDGVGQIRDISYQQVQEYKTGHGRLSARNLFVLTRAFDVEPAAFFRGLDRPDSPQVGPDIEPEDIVLAQLARIAKERPEVAKVLIGISEALAKR